MGRCLAPTPRISKSPSPSLGYEEADWLAWVHRGGPAHCLRALGGQCSADFMPAGYVEGGLHGCISAGGGVLHPFPRPLKEGSPVSISDSAGTGWLAWVHRGGFVSCLRALEVSAQLHACLCGRWLVWVHGRRGGVLHLLCSPGPSKRDLPSPFLVLQRLVCMDT